MSAIGGPPPQQSFEQFPKTGGLNGGMHYSEAMSTCNNIIKTLAGCFNNCCDGCCRTLQCCVHNKYTKSRETMNSDGSTTHTFVERTNSAWIGRCCCDDKKK